MPHVLPGCAFYNIVEGSVHAGVFEESYGCQSVDCLLCRAAPAVMVKTKASILYKFGMSVGIVLQQIANWRFFQL